MNTVWILGDQLLRQHPALTAASPADTTVLLIESAEQITRYPFNRKKIVLLLSAMRHYAAELRARGFTVDYRQTATTVDGLRGHIHKHTPTQITCMAASSYRGRMAQRQLENRLRVPVTVLPNTQFLTGTHNPIPQPVPGRRHVMENFYRSMRRHFNILMDGDEPVTGQWNYDHDNRKKLPKNDTPPPDVGFEPDEITQQVIAEVAKMDGLVGSAENFTYAVTHQQAKIVFDRFIRERLHKFGPYEDALTTRSHSLYHSMLSPYLNIGLLEPLALAVSAEKAYRDGLAPLNSVEGFVRQIIGWREFMYWQYWRQMPGMADKNHWQAQRDLPEFFWNANTNMRCMQHAIHRAIETGYNHHIERLMVISNYAMLAGLNPRQLNDWFLSLFIDAYEWVMPPNVIGMSLNADGGLTATKPYIASANYINKMGDYCKPCRFNHKQRTGEDACPFNFLYWNFILQHEDALRKNPRTSHSVLGLRHLDAAERQRVRQQAQTCLEEINA